MSVFAFHVRPRYGRVFGTLLLFAILVTGSVFLGRAIQGPLTATQLHSFGASPSPTEIRATVFPEPQQIVWEGVIQGVFAGGQGLAIRRSDTGALFQAYLPMGEIASVTEGPVRISGRYTEISCAYAESAFGGACTSLVEIESLEVLSIELE